MRDDTMTAQEILEAHDAGEPVLWTRTYALRVLADHGAPADATLVASWGDAAHVDAWAVLAWLGY